MVDLPDNWKQFDDRFFDTFDQKVKIDHSWMETRLLEMPILVALPKIDKIAWNSLYSWNAKDLENEQRLSQVCHSSGMLGCTSHEYVRADHLVELPLPKSLDRAKSKTLGWTSEHFAQYDDIEYYAISLHDRRCAAAGWLICHSSFVEEREILKEDWLQLQKAGRPRMPLWRSRHLPKRPEGTRKAPPSKRLKFQKNFDQFCDRWRITGMLTWEFPSPDGPKWPDNTSFQEVASRPESTELDTPFHFALQAKDDVGKYVRQSHEELAEKRGVTDLSKWKTYSQLMKLSFWEQVLDQRYTESPRIKSYQTVKVGLLEDVLNLDRERILKLRRTLSEFRRGKRVSLAGFR